MSMYIKRKPRFKSEQDAINFENNQRNSLKGNLILIEILLSNGRFTRGEFRLFVPIDNENITKVFNPKTKEYIDTFQLPISNKLSGERGVRYANYRVGTFKVNTLIKDAFYDVPDSQFKNSITLTTNLSIGDCIVTINTERNEYRPRLILGLNQTHVRILDSNGKIEDYPMNTVIQKAIYITNMGLESTASGVNMVTNLR